MELLLNVVWGIVACGAFLVPLPRSRGGKLPVLALACVVALLFPIISASDDLSVARDAWEESISIRRAGAIAAGFAMAQAAVLPTGCAALVGALVVLHRIETQIVPAVIRLRPTQSDPRSPPL